MFMDTKRTSASPYVWSPGFWTIHLKNRRRKRGFSKILWSDTLYGGVAQAHLSSVDLERVVRIVIKLAD